MQKTEAQQYESACFGEFMKAFVRWAESTNYQNDPQHEYSSFSFKFTKRENHYRFERGSEGSSIAGPIVVTITPPASSIPEVPTIKTRKKRKKNK